MKTIRVTSVLTFTIIANLFLCGCGDGDTPGQEALQEAAKGLSLPALTSLVKEVRSGQELERKLNREGGVNNLDLNGDRAVDYIFITEFGDPNKKIGYSLTVKPTKNEVQEVAEVIIEKNSENAEIQVTGNAQIYGDNAIYNDYAPIKRDTSNMAQGSAFPLLTSYFVARALWASPWGFGYYPPMYASFPDIDGGKYFSRNKKKYKLSKVRRGKNSSRKYSAVKIRNPNKGKSASKGIVRSLRKPTATQKQFRTTRAQNLKSGGFGRSASRKGFSSKSPSQSSGRSFGSRKSGLFSSGKNAPPRKGFSSRKSGFFSSGKQSAFGSKGSFGRSFRSSSSSSRSFRRGK